MQNRDGLRLRLEIDLSNDAFVFMSDLNRTEIVRCLRVVSAHVDEGADSANIVDVNGNRVGQWEISTCTCTSTTDDAFDGYDENCPLHGFEARRLARDEEDDDGSTCEDEREQKRIDAQAERDLLDHDDVTSDDRHALVGCRVEFRHDVDRFPHALVQAGERGTITVFGIGTICVRMDQHHDGLDEWDNEIVWSQNMDNHFEFFSDVEMPLSQQNRRVAMIQTDGYVETLLETEHHTSERLRELRRFAGSFDDGMYVATDGWMLPTWSEMYHAHKQHALNFTNDEILAARVALDMLRTFSARRIENIQTMRGRYERPTIHTARAPF